MSDEFEPKIIAFLCNWCSYGGADQAGADKRSVPANVRILRVMCSGRVDPQFIIEALSEGADGVMVLGCHPGDCHYKEGNYNTERRYLILEKLMQQFGIHEDRIYLDWVSAAEGEKFERVTNEMVERIKKLGPFPREKTELQQLAGSR
ncbi:MAG: hydrogenase iron-sulfur subunit [bacterium]